MWYTPSGVCVCDANGPDETSEYSPPGCFDCGRDGGKGATLRSTALPTGLLASEVSTQAKNGSDSTDPSTATAA